jgi:hypothetical protein
VFNIPPNFLNTKFYRWSIISPSMRAKAGRWTPPALKNQMRDVDCNEFFELLDEDYSLSNSSIPFGSPTSSLLSSTERNYYPYESLFHSGSSINSIPSASSPCTPPLFLTDSPLLSPLFLPNTEEVQSTAPLKDIIQKR